MKQVGETMEMETGRMGMGRMVMGMGMGMGTGMGMGNGIKHHTRTIMKKLHTKKYIACLGI
jgi:hypothetical protein